MNRRKKWLKRQTFEIDGNKGLATRWSGIEHTPNVSKNTTISLIISSEMQWHRLECDTCIHKIFSLTMTRTHKTHKQPAQQAQTHTHTQNHFKEQNEQMKVLVTWIAPVETLLLFNFRLFQLMFCNRMKCLIRRLKTHSGEWKESQNDKRITTSQKWRDRFFRLSFQSFTIYHSSSSWLLPSSSHFAFFFIWTICALHNDTIPSIFSILLYFSLLKDKLKRTSNIPKYELNCDNKKKPTNNYVKLHWKGRRTCRERKCNKIFKNNFFFRVFSFFFSFGSPIWVFFSKLSMLLQAQQLFQGGDKKELVLIDEVIFFQSLFFTDT